MQFNTNIFEQQSPFDEVQEQVDTRTSGEEIQTLPGRQGVEVMVAQARVTPEGIEYHRVLPVEL